MFHASGLPEQTETAVTELIPRDKIVRILRYAAFEKRQPCIRPSLWLGCDINLRRGRCGRNGWRGILSRDG
jgi:hypothetical protein